jgi:hypothetical protein
LYIFQFPAMTGFLIFSLQSSVFSEKQGAGLPQTGKRKTVIYH